MAALGFAGAAPTHDHNFSYLKQTTAVGVYPDGASPYGVLDMAGNVWEWCLNKYSDQKDMDTNGDVTRVVRGGSWDDDQVSRGPRSASGTPELPRRSSGFGCCVRPPSRALITECRVSGTDGAKRRLRAILGPCARHPDPTDR